MAALMLVWILGAMVEPPTADTQTEDYQLDLIEGEQE